MIVYRKTCTRPVTQSLLPIPRLPDSYFPGLIILGVVGLLCSARYTNTLPPLYRQINREDRLVVREGVCVLGREKSLLLFLPTHTSPSLTLTLTSYFFINFISP